LNGYKPVLFAQKMYTCMYRHIHVSEEAVCDWLFMLRPHHSVWLERSFHILAQMEALYSWLRYLTLKVVTLMTVLMEKGRN